MIFLALVSLTSASFYASSVTDSYNQNVLKSIEDLCNNQLELSKTFRVQIPSKLSKAIRVQLPSSKREGFKRGDTGLVLLMPKWANDPSERVGNYSNVIASEEIFQIITPKNGIITKDVVIKQLGEARKRNLVSVELDNKVTEIEKGAFEGVLEGKRSLYFIYVPVDTYIKIPTDRFMIQDMIKASIINKELDRNAWKDKEKNPFEIHEMELEDGRFTNECIKELKEHVLQLNKMMNLLNGIKCSISDTKLLSSSFIDFVSYSYYDGMVFKLIGDVNYVGDLEKINNKKVVLEVSKQTYMKFSDQFNNLGVTLKIDCSDDPYSYVEDNRVLIEHRPGQKAKILKTFNIDSENELTIDTNEDFEVADGAFDQVQHIKILSVNNTSNVESILDCLHKSNTVIKSIRLLPELYFNICRAKLIFNGKNLGDVLPSKKYKVVADKLLVAPLPNDEHEGLELLNIASCIAELDKNISKLSKYLNTDALKILIINSENKNISLRLLNETKNNIKDVDVYKCSGMNIKDICKDSVQSIELKKCNIEVDQDFVDNHKNLKYINVSNSTINSIKVKSLANLDEFFRIVKESYKPKDADADNIENKNNVDSNKEMQQANETKTDNDYNDISYLNNIMPSDEKIAEALKIEIENKKKDPNYIMKLMLKDVNIKTLEGISNIQDLKEISLIGCGLSQATPGINEIGKLGNLELLDMSDNNIDNISCMEIENLNNVRVIRLKNNHVTNARSFSGLNKLMFLDIRDNPELKNISFLQGCSSLVYLNASNTGISSIESIKDSKNISSLIIKDNSITDIDVLEDMSSLKYLDVSNNKLHNVLGLKSILKNIEHLNITNNDLIYIPKAITNKAESKYYKYKAQNKDVFYLNDVKDDNLAKAIIELIDSHNPSCFSSAYIETYILPQIESLDLSGRHIVDLSGLDCFHKLRSLDASDNDIKDISILSNCTLPLLESVSFANNKIHSIRALKGISFRNLVCLDLSNNTISNISSLGYMGRLKELYLSHNNLASIESLKDKINLEYLDISNNPIGEDINRLYEKNIITNDRNEMVEKSVISGLKELTASNCGIPNMPNDAVMGNITDIDISNNDLKNVDFLVGATNAKYVNLENNENLINIDGLQDLSNIVTLVLNRTNITKDDIMNNIKKSNLRELFIVLPNLNLTQKDKRAFNPLTKIQINNYGLLVDTNRNIGKAVNKVVLSPRALKVARGLNGKLNEDFYYIVEALQSGTKIVGRHEHALSGKLSNLTAVDLRNGSSKGRGKNRVLYTILPENTIMIEGITLKHYQ